VTQADPTSTPVGQRPSADDFDEFYAASYGRLVGQLAPITGSVAEAEDVVQEAFVRAAGRWGRLRDYDQPEAWVRRVAMNLATSGLRSRLRQARALARLRLGQAPAVPAVSVDDLAVAQGLRELPVTYRQVLVLHHGLGLGVEEVARELGLAPAAVNGRLRRARAALAKRLDESEEAGHDA
jgi:RNA polymerase sigma-70 factor (ECF subfamily)